MSSICRDCYLQNLMHSMSLLAESRKLRREALDS